MLAGGWSGIFDKSIDHCRSAIIYGSEVKMSDKQVTQRREDVKAPQTATVIKHISRRVHQSELDKSGIDPNAWLDS